MSHTTPDPDTPAEQMEFNLGEPSAMNDAVDAAIRATTSPGETPPSAETISAARARAAQMLEEMSQEDAEGLRDLQNLTLSMGLPATRALFRQMVVASGIRGADKEAAKREITEFSPVTEVGCMKVDFHDRTTNRGSVAYLLLDACPKAHDLGTQLDKLRSRCAEAKWPEVLRHLSMLIQIGRSVYAQVAKRHAALLGKLVGDRRAEYSEVKVDRENTTLYLNSEWPNRVGIYVKLDEEVQAEIRADAALAVTGPGGKKKRGVKK